MAIKEGRNAEEFAFFVLQTLRSKGFHSLWAGGCVRDRLLGRTPKDYDVATDATPDQVCQLFGKRRTLRIGEAFGVVAVLGKKPLHPIEVATFRTESGYSDGRHPDHVAFSSAEEDAKRRDFTINGIFFDPVENRVIDYVGGERDLEHGVIRSIGDPKERFDEDRLRMLRAIRFAATYGFQIDPDTLDAVQANAKHIVAVSAERIANEMRSMLSHANAAEALRLLMLAGLRKYVLSEFEETEEGETEWRSGLQIVNHLQSISFELVCAALLKGLPDSVSSAEKLSLRWKLANAEREQTVSLLTREAMIRQGNEQPWPQLQRALIKPFAMEAVTLANAVARSRNEPNTGINFCREKLALPRNVLNPEPLITGNDLIEAGVPPGPDFRRILEAVRDLQLDGQISTTEEAMQIVSQMIRQQ